MPFCLPEMSDWVQGKWGTGYPAYKLDIIVQDVYRFRLTSLSSPTFLNIPAPPGGGGGVGQGHMVAQLKLP